MIQDGRRRMCTSDDTSPKDILVRTDIADSVSRSPTHDARNDR